jgi:hypothetical protein
MNLENMNSEQLKGLIESGELSPVEEEDELIELPDSDDEEIELEDGEETEEDEEETWQDKWKREQAEEEARERMKEEETEEEKTEAQNRKALETYYRRSGRIPDHIREQQERQLEITNQVNYAAQLDMLDLSERYGEKVVDKFQSFLIRHPEEQFLTLEEFKTLPNPHEENFVRWYVKHGAKNIRSSELAKMIEAGQEEPLICRSRDLMMGYQAEKRGRKHE